MQCCAFYVCNYFISTYISSLDIFLFCARAFCYSSFQDGNLLCETRLKFRDLNSPLPAGLSYKVRWPGALLGWPSKTRRLARSGDAADWPFGPFSLKKGTPTGFSLCLWKHGPLCVQTPKHCTQHNNDGEWRSPHWTNLPTHKRNGTLLGISVWGLLLICRVWDQLLMLYYYHTRFFQGKACRLAWEKKVWEATHTNMKLMLWCLKLGGSCFEFMHCIEQSHVSNRAKIQSVARLGWNT